MKRLIDTQLREWMVASDRKSLLLRGARQIGKTYSVREFGKQFQYFAEINFEENVVARKLFQGSLTIKPIVEQLSSIVQMPITPGDTLLFLDEVQACPRVLMALRYFYEQMPGLHVIAAGSLLEFALEEIPSFGVGRITSRFMHPLTFVEFLDALGEERLVSFMDRATFDKPLDEIFHVKLCDYLRTYMLVGGLPMAVKTYVEHRELHRVMSVLDDLMITIQEDFSKYRKQVPMSRLLETFRSVGEQAGGKFVCSTVDTTVKSTAILNALELLQRAGLVHQVKRCVAARLPLGSGLASRHFKALLFDTGIHQRAAGLDLADTLISSATDLVNKGSMAELFVGLQMVAMQPSNRRPELYYWHREGKTAQAEVDYVIQRRSSIVPVEVKAGVRGGMQSMRLFLAQQDPPVRGLRVSLENFGRLADCDVLPLYAIHRLHDASLFT